MKLSQIADIHVGYLFRSRIEHTPDGSYQVIQMGDIDPDETINWENMTRTDLDSIKSVFLVEKGDILFKAKGSSHSAVLVDRTAENIIASSFFHIIRTKNNAVIPEFLAWYINQSPSQQHFTRMAAGTGIRYINRSNLGELEIVIPSLETQTKLVELFRLGQREKQLINEIQKKRELLINSVMLNAVMHQNANV